MNYGKKVETWKDEAGMEWTTYEKRSIKNGQVVTVQTDVLPPGKGDTGGFYQRTYVDGKLVSAS